MTLRDIVRYPDPRLRQPALPVENFDADLKTLADDLLETMRAAPGIGITLPHIGVMRRLVVIELEPGRPRFYVNPRIIWQSDVLARHEEGSVAMPGAVETVERPAEIRVAYQDLAGAAHEDAADGLLAICLQHEIDQLDGIFWLQRLSRLRRDRLVKKYEKTRR